MSTTHIKYKIFLITILSLMIPGFANAHKVIIFAWVEDDMIISQSYFNSKRGAKNCNINVVDGTGQVVHSGKTDDQGDYSFKIPKNINSELVLHLDAGQGHKAHWKISEDELKVVPSKGDIKKKKATRKKLEQKPSFFKIAAGIATIFLLAFFLKLFKKKRDKNSD